MEGHLAVSSHLRRVCCGEHFPSHDPNLVGFVVGIDGVHEFINQMATPAGAMFLPFMLAFFFSLAQLQFECRESEKRALKGAIRDGETVLTPEPAVVDRSFKYT